MEAARGKAARFSTPKRPLGQFDALCDGDNSTGTGGEFKRPGRLRVIEAEADTLEAGAAILARGGLAGSGPAVEKLGRALELLLRAEAARKRLRLRNGKSLAALFPDAEQAPL